VAVNYAKSFLFVIIQPNKKERKIVKRKILLCCAVVVVAALAILLTSCQENNPAGRLITVMNPAIENKMVDRIPLSPRLDTLDGKTLYLVDINWGGPDAAYSVFEEMKAWFAQNKPSVNVVIKRKAGMYTVDDPELWKEIAAKGNAALIGISG
jgi:predicted small secreted protein